MTVLAGLYLAAAVLVRGPWLLVMGVLLILARAGRITGLPAVGELIVLAGVEASAWWMERRGQETAPWVTVVAAAAGLAALVAGLGSVVGTAVAALAFSVGRIGQFKAAWERLLRLLEVRTGRLVLGLALILIPWPH